MKVFRSNELNQNLQDEKKRLLEAFDAHFDRYAEKPAAFSVGTKVFDTLTFGMPSEDWSRLSFKGIPIQVDRRLEHSEIRTLNRT